MNTKSLVALMTTCVLLLGAKSALAQENWTEGPVWACTAARTEPGQFQAYVKWLRGTALPIHVEEKKQGLILDWKFFVKAAQDVSDWDVMSCVLYKNYAQALDYSKSDDDAEKAIRAKQLKTPDQEKQQEEMKPRLAMRKILGTSYLREVNLRPLP